ncbi:poly-beta-1,6 N-acetyl-D-glucosamine export porin PgaA [Solimicrobium silvestre]|uniref:poly-beta-1,6 N-acetyl-D-glucosamine export porin PgaA n=1 Tax=Solimicrobium silvestre TaxID=2099400 RepID=UPI0013FE4D4B|nr:poly-beta-1,6 N-acetyl-D-glucosamine export porin PgaA [Solimicrobium silvestre]
MSFFLLHASNAAVPQKDVDALILSTKGNLSAEQLAPAIEQLRAWHLDDPQNSHLVYDLAVLLDRAGDYPAASAFAPQIIKNDAQVYALSAIAHATLKSGHFQEAEAAYQLLIAKTPDDINAHVGLVYAWMGQKRIQDALDYAQRILPSREEDYSVEQAPMLVALAELFEQRNDWVLAASSYQKVLQLTPDFRYAKRQLVFALSLAGIPYLANFYAKRDLSIFTKEEQYQLEHADIALTIHFGEAQLSSDSARSRVNTTDIALNENAELIRQPEQLTKSKFDRIVALDDRGYMEEAVLIYQELMAAKIAIPLYVKFAVADAYAYLEQPDKARDLYLEELAELGAADFGTLQKIQIPLIYAYCDTGQYREAESLAEQIVSNQAKLAEHNKTGASTKSEDYLRALEVAVYVQKSEDHLNLAEERLTTLHAQAPFNNDIRTSWASLLLARDHPHAALDEYSMMVLDVPSSLDANIGRGEILLSQNELSQAKNILPPLIDNYPENKVVLHYSRQLESYSQPFYRIETTIGRGAAQGGADSVASAIIYSAPFNLEPNPESNEFATDSWSSNRFRLFTQLSYAEGETVNNVNASRSRLSAGMDYRASDITAEASVNHTVNDNRNNGIALAMSLTISDNWHTRAAVDTNIIDLPAAALNLGVTAKQETLEIDWSKNESRKAGGELSSTQFSDSNVRDFAHLWWQERWISEPVFKLDTVLGVSASTNSQMNLAYFNPPHDKELDLDIKGDWLTWRHYQRSFKQRFDFSVGQYSQSGFGSGATAGLRYEHEWAFENELAFTYGLGRNFHPYDGEREYRNYIYLNLSGRIK